MKTIRFLGHSCFMISNDKERILIDPFLTGNPLAAVKSDELKPTLILVTHGHGDHIGDAVEISVRTGAPILGVFELVNYCMAKGAKGISAHMGGKIPFEFGWVKIVPAFHSSSTGDGVYTGHPVGFVINFYGHHIYHAGDTCIFGDMELISRLYRVDTALLPIGGNYVMDIDDAVEAARLLNCSNAIPMHYNTFPPIEADPVVFREKLENKTRANGVVLKPGEEMVLE
ncbi:MAG: metal-dependent hydrolase [Firmicutes bacterium]|nr:metal-dependent hydrolase [Bacillota bacterium]